MKQKILRPDKDIELETQDKNCDNAVSHLAEEIYVLNFYSLVYAYPFMPLVDLTFAFDELKKMVKNG